MSLERSFRPRAVDEKRVLRGGGRRRQLHGGAPHIHGPPKQIHEAGSLVEGWIAVGLIDHTNRELGGVGHDVKHGLAYGGFHRRRNFDVGLRPDEGHRTFPEFGSEASREKLERASC